MKSYKWDKKVLSIFVCINIFYLVFTKSYEFNFLTIPLGVRALGLGGNLGSLDDSSEGIFYNPAVSAVLPTTEFVFCHHLYFSGSYLSQVTVGVPMGMVGIGIIGLEVGSPEIDWIQNYTFKGKYKFSSTLAGGTLGLNFSDIFGIGAGIKYVSEEMKNFYSNKSILLYDAGLILRLLNELLLISGSVINYTSESKVPFFYNFGIGLKLNFVQQMSKLNFVFATKIDSQSNSKTYNFGIEHWGSDVIGLRVGYIYDEDKINSGVYQPISFYRAGISLRIGNFSIDYAYSPNIPLETTHNIGLSLKFPKIKKVLEKTSYANLKVEPVYFSPNNDGYKDNVFFIHDATNTKNVTFWSFTIYDSNNKPITEISSSTTVTKIDHFYVYDARLPSGEFLSDGCYNVDLIVIDTADNKKTKYVTQKKMFVVDTQKPDISITLSTTTISPDGDGFDDELKFDISVEDLLSPIVDISLKITTLTDKPIKNYAIELSTISQKTVRLTFSWDGKDEVYNNIVPNGSYKIKCSAEDLAGNKSHKDAVVIVHIPQKVYEKIVEKEQTLLYIKGAKVTIDERGVVVTYPTDELFIKGKTDIDPRFFDSLQSLAETIKTKFADKKISIEGHTDSVGDDLTNEQRSSSYAWSLYSYLVKTLGLNPQNIEVKGWGEKKPVASNKTRTGRMQNRRVEIIIWR